MGHDPTPPPFPLSPAIARKLLALAGLHRAGLSGDPRRDPSEKHPPADPWRDQRRGLLVFRWPMAQLPTFGRRARRAGMRSDLPDAPGRDGSREGFGWERKDKLLVFHA